WSITRDENGGDPALNTHIGTSSFAFANAMKVVEDKEWDFSGSTSDGSGSGSGNHTNNEDKHTDKFLTKGISSEKDGWNPWISPSSGGDKGKAKKILATWLAGRSVHLRWGSGRAGTTNVDITAKVYEDGIRGVWRNKDGSEATGGGTIFSGWGLGGNARDIQHAAKTIIDFLRRSFPDEIGKG
ncbi:MAG: hypothetical protein GY679_00920, partial [Mycoplasma sp.]|nr:hypothetical protein [Mycoplasma sp.]